VVGQGHDGDLRVHPGRARQARGEAAALQRLGLLRFLVRTESGYQVDRDARIETAAST
jgi:hypothetical protein